MHATTRQRKLFYVFGAAVVTLAVGFIVFSVFAFNPLNVEACCGTGNETHSDNDREKDNPPPKVVPPQKPICTLVGYPSSIKKGEEALLIWTTKNAHAASLTTFGMVALNGSEEVSPTQTTTYTLRATGKGGTVTCVKTITVIKKDVCPNLPGDQEEVPEGYELKYGKCVPKVDVCPNLPGYQDEVPYGYELKYGKCVKKEHPPKDVCPNIPGNQEEVPYGYELKYGKCVPIEEEEEELWCELEVSKSVIKKGESVTLSWDSEGADEGFIDEGIGYVDPEGEEEVSPTRTTTYIGTFWNDDEDVECEVTVEVKKKKKDYGYNYGNQYGGYQGRR